MVHMAGMPAGTRTSRSELASAAECPEQFLSKVLQNLTRAGLVVSHRGNTGGFELPRIHRDASILEVVEAIEGPLRLNLCLTSDHACERQSWCPVHSVWDDARKAMAEVLQKATIGELARQGSTKPQEEPLVDGPSWN
jgi:Rrf2 family transcriptional regulator, iron-sulfur cluster assembly transcription factor